MVIDNKKKETQLSLSINSLVSNLIFLSSPLERRYQRVCTESQHLRERWLRESHGHLSLHLRQRVRGRRDREDMQRHKRVRIGAVVVQWWAVS